MKGKRLHRLVCLVLGILMMFSTLTTAFAGSSWAAPGGGVYGYGAPAGSSWVNSAQFLRVSLYWAPKASAGASGIGEDGADWASPQVVHLGTFDWAQAGGYNPSADVKVHSNYTNALDYNQGGNQNRMASTYDYYAQNSNGSTKCVQAWYTLKDNSGNPMTFPRPCGESRSQTTDVKKYFTQDEVISQVMYITKYVNNTYGTGVGFDTVKPSEFKKGIYKDKFGNVSYGTYLITVEPGIYMPLKGVYGAWTMRDALAWGNSSGSVTGVGYAPSNVARAAQAVVLEPGMNYPVLGLSYKPPYTGDMGSSYVKNPANYATMRSSYGIGAFMWYSDAQQLPVINYYYDLTEEDFVRAGLLLTPDEEDSTLYHIYDADGNELSIYEAITNYPEVVNRKADNASTAAVTGNTYIASRESEAFSSSDDGKRGQVKTYNLIAGYMTNKQVTAGYLNITDDGGGLQFYDNNGKANITEEVKAHTQDPELTEQKIKQWDDSVKLATTVSQNNQVSKLGLAGSQKHITPVENGLQLNFGQDNGSLQGAFIYVDLKVPVWPDITTLSDPGEPIDPDPEDKTPYVPPQYTNVTKMYYDSPEATTPSKTTSEKIPTTATYEIEDEEEYKVVDWVIVDDNTPDEPEPYPTYEEAKDNQSEDGKTGTTPGSLGPSNWTNPDRELFIKYEKAPEEEEPEPLDGSLRLTEKRISWLKSLKDIGGIPTITFQWAAITGSETHYCGDEDCSGHSCNEHIGKDSFLRFVSSNTTPVKSDIMGNKSGFMPYDEDNVYEFNRTDDGGSYDMKPNYWYVIWRGKDIPTIASYKYGDTTGSGKATSAPIIKNLIGENMVGIKPAGARNANNNSFYMDSFTITEGKSNYDAKTLSAFVNSFGAQAGGVGDQAFANTLDEYHDISEQYEKAEEDVKLAEAEKNQRLSSPLLLL